MSLTNSEIKLLADLKERSERHRQRRYLIEGRRNIVDALKAGASISKLVVNTASSAAKLSELFEIAGNKGVEIVEIPAGKFKKLSTTETSQGIIAVTDMLQESIEEFVGSLRSKRLATVVLLDRIADPGNLGTLLRSALWFGCDAVVTGSGSVDVFNPKVVRSAMSAIAGLRILEDVSLVSMIADLKNIGFSVIGSSQTAAIDYTQHIFAGKLVVVFGAESSGISEEVLSLCDKTVMIPSRGKMESLNVAVAASIVLAEISRQRSVVKTGV